MSTRDLIYKLSICIISLMVVQTTADLYIIHVLSTFKNISLKVWLLHTVIFLFVEELYSCDAPA